MTLDEKLNECQMVLERLANEIREADLETAAEIVWEARKWQKVQRDLEKAKYLLTGDWSVRCCEAAPILTKRERIELTEIAFSKIKADPEKWQDVWLKYTKDMQGTRIPAEIWCLAKVLQEAEKEKETKKVKKK